MQAQNSGPFDLQKAPCGLRDEHRAAVPGKEKNAVLQIAQDLVEIVFQRREHLFDIAHALADLLDLGGDTGGGVLAGAYLFLLRILAGRSPVIELHADLFKGAQGQIAEQKGYEQGDAERKAHEGKSFDDPRPIGNAQERSAYAYMYVDEGLIVALQRNYEIENLWRCE